MKKCSQKRSHFAPAKGHLLAHGVACCPKRKILQHHYLVEHNGKLTVQVISEKWSGR